MCTSALFFPHRKAQDKFIAVRLAAFYRRQRDRSRSRPTQAGSTAVQEQRHRLKLLKSLEERLAKRLREEAKLLPPGAMREATLRKPGKTGSHMTEWLTSPRLRPPKHV
jgi:hypothetical protein